MVILRGVERIKGSMPTGKQVVNPKTGELVDEIVNYDNYLLHYQSDDRDKVVGVYCDNVKASADKLTVIGADSVEAALNKQVVFGYDVTARADLQGKIKPVVTSLYVLPDNKGGAK